MKASKDLVGQKRGGLNSDNDKVRICVEARQAIINYWQDPNDPDNKIQGRILKSAVTGSGKYANLQNIDDQHKFITDEKLMVGGKNRSRESWQKDTADVRVCGVAKTISRVIRKSLS